MCSFMVQVVYGIICLIATAMTVVSMVTPGWTTYSFQDTIDDIRQGILPFTCTVPGKDVDKNGIFNWDDCAQWFVQLPFSEKVVVTCMCVGLAFQILSFIWNLLTLCACCCKKYIIHPLTIFTLLSVIFLAVAVIIYAINDGNYIELTQPIDFSTSIGFSFWLACGALGLNVINLVVASAAACCSKCCC